MRNRDTRAQVFRRSASRRKSVFSSENAPCAGRLGALARDLKHVREHANTSVKKPISPMRMREPASSAR